MAKEYVSKSTPLIFEVQVPRFFALTWGQLLSSTVEILENDECTSDFLEEVYNNAVVSYNSQRIFLEVSVHPDNKFICKYMNNHKISKTDKFAIENINFYFRAWSLEKSFDKRIKEELLKAVRECGCSGDRDEGL